MRSDIAKGLATLRNDPALFRMKLRQRWGRHKVVSGPVPSAGRPRVASVDQDLAAVVAELGRRSVSTGVIYGDAEFQKELVESTVGVRWEWASHQDTDVLAGAALPGSIDLTGRDAVVVGGSDVKTAYLNALRCMEQQGTVLPLLWVGKNFEYCGSTLPIPEQVESADIYLFNHFADFFPIKDPLLVRVTAADRNGRNERLVLMRPQQTVHFALEELLPDRDGTSVVEVRTTHPALTGNRHPRWRVWADLFWKDSLTSLHGAHDYGPEHVCESRIPLDECRSGGIVLTLPNYDLHVAGSDAAVRWARGGTKGSFIPNPSFPVDQITVPVDESDDGTESMWGYSYRGYGTSYWFAFDERGGSNSHASLCGNHEVTVAQVEHRPHLSLERRRLLERLEAEGFIFLPHALPILDPRSGVEFGFSFETANPQLRDFELVAFGAAGERIGRERVSLPLSGYHFSADLLAAAHFDGRPELVLISPDWKAMNMDPQHMNAYGNLAVRQVATGDRDVTEFQSCWRNLNATIDGFPHWLHPSKGVLGRTSVVGHVRQRRGLRTGLIVVNAAGNLNHASRATVKLRLHAPSGAMRVAEVELDAFTSSLVWIDDLFADSSDFLGDDGFGTCLVSCADADVNCQFLTSSSQGSVSLQHLWGY